MIVIDVLFRFFTPLTKRICRVVSYVAGLIIFLPMVYGLVPVTLHSIKILEYDGGALPVPIYPARIIILVGSTLLCVQLFLDIISEFRSNLKT
jgi:TRAP-type mannitol/chloroaromatic compound transport system permease small subunit